MSSERVAGFTVEATWSGSGPLAAGRCGGSLERIWLSAVELRALADELGPASVVVAELPPDLADMVKRRRYRGAAALQGAREVTR